MRKLKIQGRFLSWDDGEPFFYLADTAWELFHRLSREEAAEYFALRGSQGFTAVQAVALAEFEGVTTPNFYGRLPLKFTEGLPDPEKPDTDGEYSYWDHVDFCIKTAEKHGIMVSLLPTWGDKFRLCEWGKGPEIFTVENAYAYGKWIGRRYAQSPNIIWMLGGDRPLEPCHRAIVDAMAKGIREEDGVHRITFHPPGCQTSLDYMADAEYVDFHTAQTGHGVEQCYQSDAVMGKMREACEKPYLDSEPRYEGHPACFNPSLGYYWDENDVRQNLYWDLLAGACGHTYGHHAVWSMNREACAYTPDVWKNALHAPGAGQVAYGKKLRLSRDYFSLTPAPAGLVQEKYAGMGHLGTAVGKNYAYVYTPLGLPFSVDLSWFPEAKCVKASWFNPRTGKEKLFGIFPAAGKSTFAPDTQGKGCDWVLILDWVY